ncbi:MAG: YraN family protein [Bacteroidota bacterium]|nr:YraN family protein [Bacteroidota bacterium]
MMAHHNNTGVLGEKMAAKYLTAKGFTILHQNWRHSHWEVDVIASLNDILHFIEVKTRRTQKFGYPEDDVTQKKIQNLINASEEYLFINPEWKLIQFDILSILLLKDKPAEYFFIEDVYISPGN